MDSNWAIALGLAGVIGTFGGLWALSWQFLSRQIAAESDARSESVRLLHAKLDDLRDRAVRREDHDRDYDLLREDIRALREEIHGFRQDFMGGVRDLVGAVARQPYRPPAPIAPARTE